MADKLLTESDWKSFAKGQKLDDAKEASKDTKALHEAVLEALQAFARQDEDEHDAMLAALDKLDGALDKQVAANARRKDKDGKAIKDVGDVKDRLQKMQAAIDKQRKTVRAAAAEAADEEESPALLTTKMVPLIREVRKGELVLPALIAVAGKETVVLLSRRAISPSRGKLLKEQMANASSAKLIRGECLLEANALTFVVQAPAAGLAKKIKAALLAQTELRLKVRVRGEDPADVDEDLDEDAAAEGAAEGTADTTAAPGEPPAAPVADEAERLAYEKKLAELDPRIADALGRQVGDVGKIRAVSQFAQGKAETGAYKAALQALQALEGLLPAPTTQPQAAPTGDPMAAFKARLAALVPLLKGAIDAGTPGAEAQRARVAEASALANRKAFDEANAVLAEVEAWLGGARGKGSGAGSDAGSASGAGAGLVALQQSRLAWAEFRKSLQAQLDAIARDVLAEVQDNNADDEADEDYDVGEVRAGLARFQTLLEGLDTRLIDKLDAALNAGGDERARLQQEAKAIVAEYQGFVGGNALIAAIDANGFVDTSIRRDADKVLRELAAQL